MIEDIFCSFILTENIINVDLVLRSFVFSYIERAYISNKIVFWMSKYIQIKHIQVIKNRFHSSFLDWCSIYFCLPFSKLRQQVMLLWIKLLKNICSLLERITVTGAIDKSNHRDANKKVKQKTGWTKRILQVRTNIR